MKRLFLLVFTIIAIQLGGSAQVKPADKTKPATSKTAAAATVKKDTSRRKARPAGLVLKKDGTPDRRYKNSVPHKKDGTPDKRYKVNKDKKPSTVDK